MPVAFLGFNLTFTPPDEPIVAAVFLDGTSLLLPDVFTGAHVGELDWAFIGAPPPGYTPTFYSYCLDVTQELLNPQMVTLTSTNLLTIPTIPDAGKKAAWLFNNYGPAVHSVGDPNESGALQIAIWEALYDTTPDLTSGNFQAEFASPSATAAALSYLAGLYSGGPPGYHTDEATWLDAEVGAGQDLITNPEPASLVLCGIGLFGLATWARRKRRAATPARDV